MKVICCLLLINCTLLFSSGLTRRELKSLITVTTEKQTATNLKKCLNEVSKFTYLTFERVQKKGFNSSYSDVLALIEIRLLLEESKNPYLYFLSLDLQMFIDSYIYTEVADFQIKINKGRENGPRIFNNSLLDTSKVFSLLRKNIYSFSKNYNYVMNLKGKVQAFCKKEDVGLDSLRYGSGFHKVYPINWNELPKRKVKKEEMMKILLYLGAIAAKNHMYNEIANFPINDLVFAKTVVVRDFSISVRALCNVHLIDKEMNWSLLNELMNERGWKTLNKYFSDKLKPLSNMWEGRAWGFHSVSQPIDWDKKTLLWKFGMLLQIYVTEASYFPNSIQRNGYSKICVGLLHKRIDGGESRL